MIADTSTQNEGKSAIGVACYKFLLATTGLPTTSRSIKTRANSSRRTTHRRIGKFDSTCPPCKADW